MKTKRYYHLKESKAQAMTEYIIIVSLIAIACMAGFILYQRSMAAKTSEISKKFSTIDPSDISNTQYNISQTSVLSNEEKQQLQGQIKQIRSAIARLNAISNLAAFGVSVSGDVINIDQAADINSKTITLLRIEAARLEAKLKNNPELIELEVAKIAANESIQSAIDILFDTIPLPAQAKWVANWVRLPIKDGTGQLTEVLIEYTFN